MSQTTTERETKYEAAFEHVPAIATTSLNEMLDAFCAVQDGGGLKGGYSYLIQSVSTDASKEIDTSMDMRVPEIGLEASEGMKRSEFNFSYQIEYDDSGLPVNELDSHYVKKVQKAESVAGVQDSAIDEITIRFYDEKMGELDGTGRDDWVVTFRSDPIHGDEDRSLLDKYDINQQLVEDEGFQYRILNCHQFSGTNKYLNGGLDDSMAFDWNGNTFAGLKVDTPTSTLNRIRSGHAGGYGELKQYRSSKEDSIELMGSVENEQTGGN